MSWFTRKKDFEEEADILGDDFEAEFDGIADAFNGLFKAGETHATSNLALSGAYQDAVGADLAITPSIPSLLLVWAYFDFELQNLQISPLPEGTIKVDGGAEQAVTAPFRVYDPASSGTARAVVSQFYQVSLTAAAHTIKMRAKSSGGEEFLLKDRSRLVYLLIPAP